jgi:hypothetical protein
MFFAAILVLALAAPASAGPPTRVQDPFPTIFPDLENGLVVFVNSDRAQACSPDVVAWEEDVIAWIEGGEVGEFPPLPEFPTGLEPIDIQESETGRGAIVYLAMASGLPIELWELEDDAPLVGPCTDTDDAMRRVAAGTATFRANDNDLFGSGTRGNAYGHRGHANLTDDAGNAWSYSWLFHVNSRCYAPEDGPPRCLLESGKLLPR